MSVNIIEKIKYITEDLKHYAWIYYKYDASEISNVAQVLHHHLYS